VSRDALEAACRAAPDDPVPWGVYRDWLIAQGDMRGELAARIAAGEAEATALGAARRRHLLGGPQIEITRWRHGFPIAARLRDDLERIAPALLAKPFAVFIDSLRFGLSGTRNDTWEPVLAAVAASPQAAHLRELRFDDFSRTDAELSWVAFGDFSAAWRMLPRLETLVIKSGAGGTLGEIDLPELRRFERISGGLSGRELASIASARWPKLEHLELWTGSADYGANTTVADLLPILAGEGLPTLRHLGIVNSELVDALIEPLARSPLLTRLLSLDLSKGILARAGAARLVEQAAAFRHLSVIELGENHLTPRDLARIRAVLPQAAGATQRERYEQDEDDEDFGRYVAVGE
jgi:uncharacterized protein (TIGR02996 family)